MLGKTFKGLTDEMLALADRAAAELAVEQRRLGRPACGRSWSSRSPSTACRPRPRYPGGMALRFARVLRHRPDKRPEEADTVDAVRAIHGG